MIYLWIKALHIIAVICWFAALFYLPRLFVYHAMSEDEPSKARFIIMERKLYRGIMTPSMILTVVLGLWLLQLNPGWLQMGWMHAKLALVAGTIGYHHVCRKLLGDFEQFTNRRSHRWFRVFNEVSVLLFAAIAILVVVKPF